MEVTTMIAIYGAVVGSSSLAWNIRIGIRDRARLKVALRLGSVLTDGNWKSRLMPAKPSEQVILVITVANTGRRAITINAWGGEYEEPVDGVSHYSILSPGFPVTLQKSNEHHEPNYDLDAFLAYPLKSMCVLDSGGRKWAVSKKNLSNTIAEAKSIRAVKAAAQHQDSAVGGSNDC